MGELNQSKVLYNAAYCPSGCGKTIEVHRWNRLGMRAACSFRAGHAKRHRGSWCRHRRLPDHQAKGSS